MLCSWDLSLSFESGTSISVARKGLLCARLCGAATPISLSTRECALRYPGFCLPVLSGCLSSFVFGMGSGAEDTPSLRLPGAGLKDMGHYAGVPESKMYCSYPLPSDSAWHYQPAL